MREGRTTVYNNITTPEKLSQVNPENIELKEDFLDYLKSVGRAKSTITQYEHNLNVFFVWNLEFNKNKFFVDLSKRDVVKFQNHCIDEWQWSPRRIRTVKATLSSMSNFIEAVLDDEYPSYRPIINKIESPVNAPVREKSVFTFEDLNPLLEHLVAKKEYMKAAILALAMFSGRRKAELTRFKVSYFDKENLICGGALHMTPEPIVTKGRGVNGKLLTVYTLAKQFQPYFDLWIQYRKENGIESEWLFPDKDNPSEHIEPSVIDNMKDEFSKFLGKPWYPHSCRSTYCSYLLEQNIPQDVVQSIIGWESIEMISHYDNRTKESQFEKYFGEDGIKQVESKGLDDL